MSLFDETFVSEPSMRQPVLSPVSRWRALGIALVAIAGLFGCEPGASEDGDTAPPPARQTARGFLKAVQYGDVERAWEMHVASTEQGAYCQSKAFADVLEKTRETMTEADCKGAKELDPTRRASLAADARLLVQILRFACEYPDGDCVDYQKQVFTSQMPESSLGTGLGNFEIGELRTDGDTATVYVDYWKGKRDETSVHRESLELRRMDGEWAVTTTFGPEAEKTNGNGTP